MFSSAIKSFSSNISSNYALSPNPSSTSGPWKIFDAKKKSTGKLASVFVFDKKSLDPRAASGSFGGRSNNTSLKRAHEEVVDRLKKEASSLARLRHPCILELVEPVEETRNGGLMFATEPVTASLAGLLQEKDEQERAGGVGGRRSRYVVEDSDGQGRKRRELEIDELEIQKGLLQIGKALEFLHESAGLVHGNLTPEAIFVNSKSDWKIACLGFSSPPEGSDKPTSVTPISLSEVLNYDGRLPRSVQLNLDYTSPDFALDHVITTSSDMFSLGLLVIALYNSPHNSPLECHGSLSSYKKLFSSPSTIPTVNNNFLCTATLPKNLVTGLLPRLIARRPAQRMSAKDFQEAPYFDNMLVSAIRFLESLPTKTPSEKSQFMKGLPRIMSQFPKSVLEKKVLPALLDETKDKELLTVIVQDVFKIISLLAAGKRTFAEQVVPKFREIFIAAPNAKGQSQERDSSKESALMVVLENMSLIVEQVTGKEFKDDILPIIITALESPTHYVVDGSLRTLPAILSVLDFSTVKNEVFPVIATVFSKTSSMGIKIRGLEALQTLCGSTPGQDSVGDGLDGISPNEHSRKKASSSCVLDKYTVQEKVVPLLRAIKTKEPAVMMASLEVFKQVGKVADADYIAFEVLPILWNFSLGPLLNLHQFQQFMALIKALSTRVETEQTRKLQELASSAPAINGSEDFMNFGGSSANAEASEEIDFESLVLGRRPDATPDMMDGGWSNLGSSRPTANRTGSQRSVVEAPAFSWSSPPVTATSTPGLGFPVQNNSRSVTPDATALSSFSTLNPTTTSSTASYNQPLQPSRPAMGTLSSTQSWASSNTPTNSLSASVTPASSATSSINWSAAGSAAGNSNPWGSPSLSTSNMTQSTGMMSLNSNNNLANSLVKPPSPYSNFNIAPPPIQSATRPSNLGSSSSVSGLSMGALQQQQQQQQQQQPWQQQQQTQGTKQGMSKYESLL